MRQLRCNSCLEETENYPCSHCGYAPTEENQIRYALTGHVLAGRYLVGRILGQGGFGITYLGLDLKLQTKVAIKEFYPSGHVSRYITMGTRLDWNHTPAAQSMRSNGVEAFLKEARKMSKVAHINNVVGVRDLVEENDTAYIIMNYISGTTLKDILAKDGPMDWPRAKEVFLPTIQTMAQVHKAGLVHRDISPDNLMLLQYGQVQILDLGAAKDISVDGGLTSALVAKAGFSPLEQYGSTGQSGTWTDVYAMAATIYYTLTGILPPPATDRLDQDKLRWDLPRLQNLPQPVLSALQKAMAIRVANRTQTMELFLEALQAVPDPPSIPVVKEEAKKKEPAKKDVLEMLHIVIGDITAIAADAIVNSTDSSYSGTGGIDYSIHRAAGKELKQALLANEKLTEGQAIITSAFGIKSAKWIIHTVGPKWKTGFCAEEYKLAECYRKCLQLAIKNNCETIAFPCISVGAKHFPEKRATEIALQTIYNMMNSLGDTACLKQILFVCSSKKNAELYKNHLKRMIIDEFMQAHSPESFNDTPLYFTYMKLLAELQWGKIGQYQKYCYNFRLTPNGNLPNTYTEYDRYALNMDKWDFNTCLAYIIYLQRSAYMSGGLENPHGAQCANGTVRRVLIRMKMSLA